MDQLPAGYAQPKVPPLGVFGSVAPGGSAEGSQAIIVGGGYINWQYGRNGWAILVSYLNGWPHSSLTSAVAAGATSLPVNDCTGWAIDELLRHLHGRYGQGRGLRAAGSHPRHRHVRHRRTGEPDCPGAELPAPGRDDRHHHAGVDRAGVHPVLRRRGADQGGDDDDDP